jgi:hypothetical protein
MPHLLIALLMFVTSITPTAAQRAKPSPLPRAEAYVLPVAELLRVDEGVFEVPVGGTIDLTDRRLFLSIRSYSSRRARCCNLYVNGEQVIFQSSPVGARVDLKQVNKTKSFVEDKENCFLDVVDVVMPKGAPWIATFRLYCP